MYIIGSSCFVCAPSGCTSTLLIDSANDFLIIKVRLLVS